MFEDLCAITIFIASAGAVFNYLISSRYKKQVNLDRICQRLLTNLMIEHRNRYVHIIKANYMLMKFSHENLKEYKSELEEEAFEDDAEVPEEFTKRLNMVLEELQARITKLEISEMIGDLKEDMTYDEIMRLAMTHAKEGKHE